MFCGCQIDGGSAGGGGGVMEPCTISSGDDLRSTFPHTDTVEGCVFTGDNSFPYNIHYPVNFSTC